jgi:hypothetical protein
MTDRVQVIHHQSHVDPLLVTNILVPITQSQFFFTVSLKLAVVVYVDHDVDNPDDDARTEDEVNRDYQHLYDDEEVAEGIDQSGSPAVLENEGPNPPRQFITPPQTQAHLPFHFAQVLKVMTGKIIIVDSEKLEIARENFMKPDQKQKKEALEKGTGIPSVTPSTFGLQKYQLSNAADIRIVGTCGLSRVTSAPARLVSTLEALGYLPTTDSQLLVHQAKPAETALLRVQSQSVYLVPREWNESEQREMRFWRAIATKMIAYFGLLTKRNGAESGDPKCQNVPSPRTTKSNGKP